MALGISKDDVKMASGSRKGYWRMAGKSIVQRALTKQWLWDQGVPNMRQHPSLPSATPGQGGLTFIIPRLRARCKLLEPPSADPHAWWCGSRDWPTRSVTGHPIGLSSHMSFSLFAHASNFSVCLSPFMDRGFKFIVVKVPSLGVFPSTRD